LRYLKHFIDLKLIIYKFENVSYFLTLSVTSRTFLKGFFMIQIQHLLYVYFIPLPTVWTFVKLRFIYLTIYTLIFHTTIFTFHEIIPQMLQGVSLWCDILCHFSSRESSDQLQKVYDHESNRDLDLNKTLNWPLFKKS